MSRKDSRRALIVALPRDLLMAVRVRQARSRGRRLSDTLRVMVAEALARQGPLTPLAPPDTPARRIALQLPGRERAALSRLAAATGATQSDLVRGCLALCHDGDVLAVPD